MNIDGLSFIVGMILGVCIITVIVICAFVYIKHDGEDKK